MRKVVTLLLLFCTICTTKLIAQSSSKITIKGVVVSTETNLPLQGASIIIKGEGKGLSTDSLGSFSLKIDQGKTIVVSYIGYDNQEITPTKSQSIVVQLKSSNGASDEVIVIGYGTQKNPVLQVQLLSTKTIK
jgi:hypothetical protein